MKEPIRFCLSAEADLLKQAKREAKARDMSLSEFIRQCIGTALAMRKAQKKAERVAECMDRLAEAATKLQPKIEGE